MGRAGRSEEEQHRGNTLQLDFNQEKFVTKIFITDRSSPANIEM